MIEPRRAYGKLSPSPRSARAGGFADLSLPGGGHTEPGKVITHGIVEKYLAELFRIVGLWVGRNPYRAIGSSLFLAICCAFLIPTYLEFEADPIKLYIPQRSALAAQRTYIEKTFGIWDEPGILVVKHKVPGASITSADFLLSAMHLHERVQRVEATSPSGQVVRMTDVCAHRFVTLTGEYMCAVLSVLEQWGYSKDKLASDNDISGTLAKAHANSEIDLGGMVVSPSGHMVSAQALQIKYFFNVSEPHYHEGGTLAWDRALRSLLDEVNAEDPLLQLSYWSALFIEEEAQSFVHKDAYLMVLSMVFIMFYVCIALGGVTHDIRTSRMLLGTTSAVCVALAMAAGFGLGAACGYPFTPINPIIVFTLLGVSVDDMIIIVDAFEHTSPGSPVEHRLSESMAVSGSTITVTSFTSAFVFFTAIWVDFPALTNFCVPAGFCVLCVYALQLFFFAGCLVLDTLRQEAGRADLVPCFKPQTDEDAAYCVHFRPKSAHPDILGRDPTGAPVRPERPIQIWFRTRYPDLLLQPRTRVLVVVGFLAPVLLAARLIPSITVGLPLRQTLAKSSPVLDYVNDLEEYWKGAQTQEAWMVYRRTNFTDARALRAADRAMSALTELDSVLRIHVNWLAGFRDWYECRGEQRWPPQSSLAVSEFIHDENVYTCMTEEGQDSTRKAHRDDGLGPNARGSVGGLAMGAASEGADDDEEEAGAGSRAGARYRHHGASAHAALGEAHATARPATSARHSVGAGLAREEDEAEGVQRAHGRGLRQRGTSLAAADRAGRSASELRRRLSALDAVAEADPRVARALSQQHAATAPPAAAQPATDLGERATAAANARAAAVSAHAAAVRARTEAAQARQAAAATAAAARMAARNAPTAAPVVPLPVVAPAGGGASGGARARGAHGARSAAASVGSAAAAGDGSAGAAPPPEHPPPGGALRCIPMPTRLSRTPDEAREFLPGAIETGHCTFERPASPQSTDPKAACASKYFCNGLHSGCWQCRDPPTATSKCVPEANRTPRAQAEATFASPQSSSSEVAHCSLLSADGSCANYFHCAGSHGACFRCAEPGRAGRAAATHRAHSTVNSRGTAEPWDPEVPCFDSNTQFERLSGKYTCAEAVSHCVQGETGWRIVRAYCPLSCGLCTPVARDNATATGGAAAGAGAEEGGGYEVAVGGRDYETDVVVGSRPAEVEASRIVFSTSMPPTFVDVYATYRQQQAALDDLAAAELKESGVRLDAFVYHIQFEFAYADWMTPAFGAQNLAMAAGAVLVCVALFLPVSIALLCTFAVVCIDVLLLGGMALLQTPLNTITLVSLLLAMALAIDYSCHIGHAYVIAPGTTRLEKTHHALEYMGFSVLNAGLSTLLGTLFLAGSQSPVFRIFFVAVWSTILLGLIAGLAFVPVMLSYVGPLDDVPLPARSRSRPPSRPSSRPSSRPLTRTGSRHELTHRPSFGLATPASARSQPSSPPRSRSSGARAQLGGRAQSQNNLVRLGAFGAASPAGGLGGRRCESGAPSAAPLFKVPVVDRADPPQGALAAGFSPMQKPMLTPEGERRSAHRPLGYPLSPMFGEQLGKASVAPEAAQLQRRSDEAVPQCRSDEAAPAVAHHPPSEPHG